MTDSLAEKSMRELLADAAPTPWELDDIWGVWNTTLRLLVKPQNGKNEPSISSLTISRPEYRDNGKLIVAAVNGIRELDKALEDYHRAIESPTDTLNAQNAHEAAYNLIGVIERIFSVQAPLWQSE
jgi:hypothetical protein